MFDNDFDIVQQGIPDHDSSDGFRGVIGETPQQIVGIERRLVGLQFQTGVITKGQNGLVQGDKVRIMPNTADTDSIDTFKLFSNEFTVTGAGVDAMRNNIFIISIPFKSGMRMAGTWQRAEFYIECPKGKHKDTDGVTCIADDITCKTSQKLVNGVCVSNNNWVWWLVGGVSVVAVGIIAVKLAKRNKAKL
jgi:hypothetical protein